MEKQQQEKTGWHLKIRPEVSIGDLILALGLVVGGLAAFFTLSERVSVNAAAFVAYKEYQEARNQVLTAAVAESRESARAFRNEVINQLQLLNTNVVLLRERVAKNEERATKGGK